MEAQKSLKVKITDPTLWTGCKLIGGLCIDGVTVAKYDCSFNLDRVLNLY